MNKRKTTRQFIYDATATHGVWYYYNKSVYKGNKVKLIIGCPKHGDFEQAPSSHLSGHGCKQCYLDRIRTTEDMMIKQAREVHGKKYWYNLIDYKGWDTKIDILCSEHGVFSQTPHNHVHGKQRCPECSNINASVISDNPGRARYQTFENRLLPVHSIIEGEYGELLVPCYVCGEQFAPSSVEANNVCRSLLSVNHGVGNFYCSDTCKKNDPSYRKHHKSLSDWHVKVAKLTRKMTGKHKLDLLNVQTIEYGYTFCECCGENKDNLELHHTIGVINDPWTAMDPDTHIIACEECHRTIHNRCRLPLLSELQQDIDNGGLNDLSDESIRIRLRLLQDQIDRNGHSFCNHCSAPFPGKVHHNKDLYLAKDPDGFLHDSSEDHLLLCFRCIIKLYREYRWYRKLSVVLNAMNTLKP